ncbi:carbohydrate ABC transporter permease [Actinoalloteichus spitiensis]|uniref:carbohydrate ABC transporter permease n=1 Tax=Actinoalloteichus spitiensis TaxID=252394 RepID=UPI00036E31CE|nr:sugar ABC transporter permease [Actinoalloteichus spitiensis]
MPNVPLPSDPRRRARRRRDITLALAFLAPSLLVFAVFVFFPLGQAVFLATRGSDLFGRPTVSVGFGNFAKLLTPEFGGVLLLTLGYVVLVVVPSIVLPLALAVPMAQRLPGMRLFRTAFALPFAYSVAAASVVFSLLYNPGTSVLNWVLESLGGQGRAWLTDPSLALVSVALVTVWMNTGFNLLVLSAALAGRDEEVLEAAVLDGARGPSMLFRITIPLITPSLFFLVVVTTLNALQSFGQIFILTRGGPNGATGVLVYSIYDTAFANNASDFGLASAQGLVLLLVGLALAAIQFGIIERRVHYQ